MAQHGATLQAQTLELVRCLQDLQQQRAALVASAREEEAEQARVAADLAVLQRRAAALDASLEKKRCAREAFDRVIGQTENALSKIVESSQMLLTVTKRSVAEVASLSPVRSSCGSGGGGLAVAAMAQPR